MKLKIKLSSNNLKILLDLNYLKLATIQVDKAQKLRLGDIGINL